MRSIVAVILLLCLPLGVHAEWVLVAEDHFDGGPALDWSMELRGSGSAGFANDVMVLQNSSGWSVDARIYGSLAVLEQPLPPEYRITYRIRNKAICGWFYTAALQGPFGDLSGAVGYAGVTEYCGPNMFIASLPSADGWTSDRLAEWHDSHLGLEPGRWREVEMSRQNGTVSFQVEGETNLVAVEPSAHPGGYLNFYAHDGYIDIEIDDLKVYAWQPPLTTPFGVTLGTSWDGTPLQQILDEEYGPGAIDVATDYEGYLAGDGDPAWWQDFGVNSLLVREIAGWENRNTMGWYLETLNGPPAIDGTDDGVIFEGPAAAGAEFFVSFPTSTRFGFYLNPNGSQDATNAPEPETHFTNRFYNDIGPDGSGALHAPLDGDAQCLIFNITHLRGGVPTYVVAWEDIDSGSPLSATWSSTTTDNDFNDLVVEISAFSPVKVEAGSWGEIKTRYQD